MDDIDSRNQIEGLRSALVGYKARFAADLSRIVAEINGNVVRLHPKN